MRAHILFFIVTSVIILAGCDRHGITTVTIESKFGLSKAQWIPIDTSAFQGTGYNDSRTDSDWDKAQYLRVPGPVQIVILPIAHDSIDNLSYTELKMQLEACKAENERLKVENRSLKTPPTVSDDNL